MHEQPAFPSDAELNSIREDFKIVTGEIVDPNHSLRQAFMRLRKYAPNDVAGVLLERGEVNVQAIQHQLENFSSFDDFDEQIEALRALFKPQPAAPAVLQS